MTDSALTIVPPTAITASADADLLSDEFNAHLAEQVAVDLLSQATADTYSRGLARFLFFAAERRAVSGDVVMAWVASLRAQGCKPTAINTWLAGVRAFFAWAQSQHRIGYNPAEGVKGARRLGSKRKHQRDKLTDSEMLRLLALPGATDKGVRDRAYLALRAFTGVRDVELYRADLADVGTRGNRTVLRIQGKGHTAKDDFVVLVPMVEHVLRDWIAVRGGAPGPLFTSLSNQSEALPIAERRLSLRGIRWMVKEYFKAAGITGQTKTSHSIRHSAISSVVDHGAPIQKAQSLARHEDMSTTAIYYHEEDRLTNPAEEFIRYDEH